jgi:hypothetical protein
MDNDKELLEVSEEEANEIRAKVVRTARDELILAKFEARRDDSRGIAIPARFERFGEDIHLLTPDGDLHEPRTIAIGRGDYDRSFWVNLIIACDGPDAGLMPPAGTRGIVARDFGKLENAINDLDALTRYYMPMRIGEPNVIYAGGIGRSPGYFDCTKRLNNPTLSDIKTAIGEFREWILVNSIDPEFHSIQINFMFAGHGYDGIRGESGIVIANADLPSFVLAEMLLSVLTEWNDVHSPSRLDMYLDCCHAGAIVRDVTTVILDEQERRADEFKNRSRLGFGKLYCSSMDDESSFEMEELRHGIFSFAFLNEFSRRAPEGANEVQIALRDVAWYTELQQHPFLLDFASAPVGRFSMLVPSARLENNERRSRNRFKRALEWAGRVVVLKTPPRNGEIVINPVSVGVRAMHQLRDKYAKLERDIANDPSKREVYTRSEFYDRTKAW